MNRKINKDHIEALYEARFLNMYDLQYAEGKHYFVATRRGDCGIWRTDFDKIRRL